MLKLSSKFYFDNLNILQLLKTSCLSCGWIQNKLDHHPENNSLNPLKATFRSHFEKDIRKPNHFDIFSSQNPNCDQKLKNLWSLVTIFRHAAEKQLTKSHLFEVKWSEVYWITARNLNALLQSEGVGLAHQATQFKLQISPFPCPWISYLFNWAHSQSGNSNPFLWGRNDNTSQSIPVQIYVNFFL